MEESGVFEYWFAFLFALGFCVWFPTYVVKTKGQGISTWGLALCIVFLFIGLPLLSISLIRDVLPSLWLSFTSANYESPSISLLYGTIHKMATLDQLYVALAMICILVAIGQSIFGPRLSLLCWQPAFCRSLSWALTDLRWRFLPDIRWVLILQCSW